MAIKHIVLVTTGQPATNPRLVKEANALCDAGYNVSVCYSFWATWAAELDKTILQQVAWQGILCGGSPQMNRWLWYWTRLRQKIRRKLPNLFAFQFQGMSRAYDELIRQSIRLKGDLYVAHNLGALPVVAKAGIILNRPFGFDAEDYHSQEDEDNISQDSKKLLEDYFIPLTTYQTAASPLIARQYEKRFSGLKFQVINNVFPKKVQPAFVSRKDEKVLKLYWFSQTVGTSRGLQDILRALCHLDDLTISITLTGMVNSEVQKSLTEFITNSNHTLIFTGPISETEIFQLAANHDVGLALERKTPLNRDICLTNKIFTYLLAGNALVASNTTAQTNFLEEHPEVGFVYEVGQIEKLATQLRYWHQNREILETTRLASWTLANQKLNWEEESKKFVSLIDGILNNQ